MMPCVNTSGWHCNLESVFGITACFVRSLAFSLDVRIGVRQDLASVIMILLIQPSSRHIDKLRRTRTLPCSVVLI